MDPKKWSKANQWPCFGKSCIALDFSTWLQTWQWVRHVGQGVSFAEDLHNRIRLLFLTKMNGQELDLLLAWNLGGKAHTHKTTGKINTPPPKKTHSFKTQTAGIEAHDPWEMGNKQDYCPGRAARLWWWDRWAQVEPSHCPELKRLRTD